eukprot:3678470-Rhodomonas_salina.1
MPALVHALYDLGLLGCGLLGHSFHGSRILVSVCPARQSIQAVRGSHHGSAAGVHLAYESWKSGRI